MIPTNCGCGPKTGACAEHKLQNQLGSSVADAVSEMEEPRIPAEYEHGCEMVKCQFCGGMHCVCKDCIILFEGPITMHRALELAEHEAEAQYKEDGTVFSTSEVNSIAIAIRAAQYAAWLADRSEEELVQAIAFLDAKEIVPGKYAYYYEPDKQWHIVGGPSLKSLAAGRAENSSSTMWAASAVKMPTWWTPKRQYATRYTNESIEPDYCTYESRAQVYAAMVRTNNRHAVTASLETGEEILA